MPSETPLEEPEEPQPRDKSWDKMSEFVKAAMDMGITDVSEMEELFDRTANEDLRAWSRSLLRRLENKGKRRKNLNGCSTSC